ncbi:MAG TPA: DUF4112 domain-containing protein [Thermoanaerobaculia bacterium]
MPAEKIHIPEVIEPDEKLPADLVALRKFSILMDEAVGVPGTKFRFGLDPLLSLVPGIGDVISALLSAWIVAGALRHRVPMRKISLMVFNILLDMTLGEIPLLGNLFDVVFEENVINMRILMRHRNRQLPPRKLSEVAGTVAVIVLVIIVVGILSVAALIAGVIWIAAQRNG